MVTELLNSKNSESLDTVLNDICLEDCVFKSPALKVPVVGRHHIQEFFRSIMRSSDSIHIEIYKCEEKEIGGAMVVSSFYIITGA